jgi:predicted enzyme related to lactoylglutathione lyase
MINKIKYLFLLILCAGVIGVVTKVSAQNGDKVLVMVCGKSLKQSDIDKLIKFYEWAFQTEFTAEQREQFQQLKEAEFRNNPVEAKKGNDDIGGFLPKVRASSQSEQERIRNTFNAEFVPNLRKATNDAEAQFLVSIYEAAQAKGDLKAIEEAGYSSGVDISSLIGKWVWSRTGSGTWNTATGGYVGGNGSRFTYQFSPSGAVEYTGIINVMMGGCSQQVFMSKKGHASLSGETLTIKWSTTTSTRDFSCDRANNYTKTLPAETETLRVSFKSNSTGQKLFCTTTGKDETCFSPSR